jgi:hypothetical protein
LSGRFLKHDENKTEQIDKPIKKYLLLSCVAFIYIFLKQ